MKKIRNEIKDLRQFGAVLAGILLVFGVVNFLKGRIYWYPWFFGLSVIMVVLVMASPQKIRPVFIVFTKVAHIIGWVNTRIILALIYFILITPAAIIMKILGKDPLNKKTDKNKMSYWTKCAIAKAAKANLEKQF